MAVGMGSMARASKAAAEKKTQKIQAAQPAKKAAAVKEPETKAETAKAPEKKIEAEGVIVYEKSSQMLDRAAAPEERFGVGDAMPVYYF